MTTNYDGYYGFWPTYNEVRFLDFLGTGIWCGVIFIVSGAVGLMAGIKPTNGRLAPFEEMKFMSREIDSCQGNRAAAF
jgi:hypothetical protein